ncbi:MAG: hypothetical protein SO253_05980 [Bacilli bacterium]|nr:hypothetical protein [Bacilli bacterium]
MKKFYTLFIITLLACINIVLVGYSTFYFNTEVSSSPNVDVAVNNIKQNYGRSENSSDYFDVYVFPQPEYANYDNPFNYHPKATDKNASGSKGREAHGIGGVFYGYWDDLEDKPNSMSNGNSSTFNESNFPTVKSDEAFAPRTLTNVYKRMTIQQLETIGFPRTAMVDHAFWIYQFTGWTAYKNSAINNGYGGMKDFNLIDSLVPLSYIDRLDKNGNYLDDEAFEKAKNVATGVDGSLVGDGKIYIYPIFAIGKDYAVQEKPNLQPASFDLSKGKNYDKVHKFLPLSIINGEKVYSMKNIYLSEEDVKQGNKYTLSLDISARYKDGWGISPAVNGSSLNQEFPNTANYTVSSAPIIDKAGYYNVYSIIKVNEYANDGIVWTDDNNHNAGYVDYIEYDPYYKNLNENSYDTFISGITSNIEKQFFGSSKIDLGGFLSHNIKFKLWIYVERVYEYKITGGPADTFDYYSLSAPLIFNKEKNGSGENYTEIYTSENIYFNSDELSFKYKYPSDQSSTGYVINQFKETVFTLAADNSGVLYNLKKETQTNIQDGYSGALLEVPKPGTKIGPDVDYTYTYDSTYLNNKVLKVKEPGYYDFRFRVVYVNQVISEIYVSCRKVADVVAYVKLVNYVNKGGKFDRIQPLSGNFIDIEGRKSDSSESGPFDKAVSNYYSGTSNEFYYTTPSISTNTGFVQLNSISFDKIKASTGEKVGEVSLATILGDNYELVDHTTGLTVDINSNSVIRLSHIFYIREKVKS